MLRFDLPLDNEPSGSLTRARNVEYECTRSPNGESYIIAFADSVDVHDVVLLEGPDGWDGHCYIIDEDGERQSTCPGYAHHDGPCAHLWAVRSYIARRKLEDDDRRYADDVDQALAADGGVQR